MVNGDGDDDNYSDVDEDDNGDNSDGDHDENDDDDYGNDHADTHVEYVCVCCTWLLVSQKQVSKAGTRDYTPQYMWNLITCPCPKYLLLAHKSTYVKGDNHHLLVPKKNGPYYQEPFYVCPLWPTHCKTSRDIEWFMWQWPNSLTVSLTIQMWWTLILLSFKN